MAQPARAEGRYKIRGWQVILATLVLLLCIGFGLLAALTSQTTILSTMYVNAISSRNAGLAQLLGDHFSKSASSNQQTLQGDIQRDLAWLGGKSLSNVTATREQTLSGQWVTVVRFNYRDPNSNMAESAGALRVKTETWWLFTYVRTVERIAP